MAVIEPFWKRLSGNEQDGAHFILGASYKDMNLRQGSVDRYVYIRGWVSRLWDFFFVWIINSLNTWRRKRIGIFSDSFLSSEGEDSAVL